jgi:hypothetical protein
MQPLLFAVCTLKQLAVFGVIVMLFPVNVCVATNHRKVLPPCAVYTAEEPGQTDTAGETEIVGFGTTVKQCTAVLVQPFVLVPVTV